MYKYELVYTGMYEYVLAFTSTCRYVPVHTSMYYTYFLLLEYSDTNWNMPGCPFWYSLIPPCILLSSSGYEEVQGGTRQWNLVQWGTRQYQKVPYPWIWRYMKVQGLVPPCTSISRGTGLSGTALYRLVPPRIQKRTGRYERNQNLRNMLVCTSTYMYILVHTDSYQSCKSM